MTAGRALLADQSDFQPAAADRLEMARRLENGRAVRAGSKQTGERGFEASLVRAGRK